MRGYLGRTIDGKFVVFADEPIKEGEDCFNATTNEIVKFDDNIPMDAEPYCIVANEDKIPKELLDSTEIGDDIEW